MIPLTAIKKGLLLNLLMLSLTLLWSCGRNDTGKVTVKSEQNGVKAVERSENNPPAGLVPSQSYSVTILPADPTVESDLRAVFSGDSKSLDFRWERDGKLIEGEHGDRLERRNFKKGDEIKVVVTSNGVERDAIVAIGDAPPAVASLTFFPQDIWSGKDISVEARGNDPDGDSVTFDYQWVINGADASMQNGQVLKGDQFKRGDTVTVTVVPSDGAAKGKVFTPAPMVVQNAPPLFTSTPPKEFSSRVYAYQAQAADPDGDPVIFSLSNGPDGMKISGDGVVEWSIQDGVKGTFDLSINADDGHGGKTVQNYKMTVDTAGK